MTSEPDATATTSGARSHARSQAGTISEHMVTVPASAYPYPTGGVDPAALTWAERVAPGGYAARVVLRGSTIRFRDLEGEACAHVVLWRAGEIWERLNVADTVKVQWQAYLGAGSVLLSDQGRVLASILADTTAASEARGGSGRHDAVCGASSLAANEERYGSGAVQGPSPSGHELLVLGAAKHGLTRRDVPPCISLFKGVTVEPASGALVWTGSAGPAAVDLRAEMDLVVVVANTAHPADPRDAWICGSLEVLAWPEAPTSPDDPGWSAAPEIERAFLNTAEDLVARGAGGGPTRATTAAARAGR